MLFGVSAANGAPSVSANVKVGTAGGGGGGGGAAAASALVASDSVATLGGNAAPMVEAQPVTPAAPDVPMPPGTGLD